MAVNDEFYRFITRIFGVDMVLLMEDTAFVLKKEEHPQEYKRYVDDLKERYRNSLIMGGAFGIALLLSLRRYFPEYFKKFSLNRSLIEITILGGTLIGSTISTVFAGAKIVYNIKKEYIINADQSYYTHMAEISQKYHVPEDSQVRLALTTEEYNEWKKFRSGSSTIHELL